jgi:catechol 2,3-dioxygenase-like lactoylglutathione lyase family enzyme
MTPRPGFICVMVNDMARSLTFYRHLGFKFPPEAYGEFHVELDLPGGMQIYWQVAQFAKLYAPDYRPAPHGMVTLAVFMSGPPSHSPVIQSRRTRPPCTACSTSP